MMARTLCMVLVMLVGCGKAVEDGSAEASRDEESDGLDSLDASSDTDTDEVTDLSPDNDNDGYTIDEDCDDADGNTHPGAEEIPYDGVDNDCVDGDLTDVDEDGEASVEVSGGTDCDDNNPEVLGSAEEVPYDGIDNDCSDGDLVDVDGDGIASMAVEGGTDCDDDESQVYPGAEEVPYDGIDNDCEDGDLVDVDGDGFPSDTIDGGTDCDDTDTDIYPGAPEYPYDGVDQDCVDGDLVDIDVDGYTAEASGGTDCNDLDPFTHPEAPEIDDEVDNDCDVFVDEDFVSVGDVIVSEVMANPGPGHEGEWFELHNTSERSINLIGWSIRDEGSDSIDMASNLVIEPGGYKVFGFGSDLDVTGGIVFDHFYASVDMRLGNTSDEIVVDMGGLVVGWIDYAPPIVSPTAPGGFYYSMPIGLSVGFGGSADDDASDFSLWCEQVGVDGPHTAGEVNSACPEI